MRPEQVIDCQADLFERTSRSSKFTVYIESVVRSGQLDGQLTPQEREDNVTAVRGYLARAVKMALAYRVTADMSMLVEHAASTLDDSDIFSPDLAPSDSGLVYFERPLPIVDARGRTMLAHWLVWGRGLAWTRDPDLPGLPPRQVLTANSFWFNDHVLGPDFYAIDIQKRFGADVIARDIGRWGFIGASVDSVGQKLGQPINDLDDATKARILADGNTPTPFTNTTRYLHALWMLLGQSVTITEDEYVRKTSFKRAQKLGLIPRVTVIRLRRNDGNRHEGESLVDWSHRWLVRGHPRWQPYGERISDHEHILGPVEVRNGHSVRFCQVSGCDHRVERIWIAPYVKGPDGKPLRFTDHVYDLAR